MYVVNTYTAAHLNVMFKRVTVYIQYVIYAYNMYMRAVMYLHNY